MEKANFAFPVFATRMSALYGGTSTYPVCSAEQVDGRRRAVSRPGKRLSQFQKENVNAPHSCGGITVPAGISWRHPATVADLPPTRLMLACATATPGPQMEPSTDEF